jgi:branched-chain amino acid transport system ATP-binding protein/urea transport system ATP-binding protein
MLILEGITAGYGGGRVLQGIDLEIAAGTVTALLGRNGMGKTTLMKAIMGLLRPSAGRILFDGRDIAGKKPYEIANAGIGYVPQGREIFPDFTVMENLLMGVLGKPADRRDIPGSLFDSFPILKERLDQKAGTMSGGQQQQLAIARALAGRPRLLLLDEPSEGIQPSIVREIAATMRAVAERDGLTVLVVEQNVEMVFDMARDCAFIENGLVAERVTVEQLRHDDALLHQYLSV